VPLDELLMLEDTVLECSDHDDALLWSQVPFLSWTSGFIMLILILIPAERQTSLDMGKVWELIV
jgi:hypothetical protein